jgi:hypothetical protein
MLAVVKHVNVGADGLGRDEERVLIAMEIIASGRGVQRRVQQGAGLVWADKEYGRVSGHTHKNAHNCFHTLHTWGMCLARLTSPS